MDCLQYTEIPGLPVHRGKVRDVYELSSRRLLMVSTDRISAFDYILPTPIPDKGRVLTQISRFWFERLTHPHHLITTDLHEISLPEGVDRELLAGRSMVVHKTQVVPIECVVRGYLAGSGWLEYQKHGTVCGEHLPRGLSLASKLPEPIFTPATKAESGHDENISFHSMVDLVGSEVAGLLREKSLDVYRQGALHAEKMGILIADTKFEWGFFEDRLLLIDEVMTPDSSRFWPVSHYATGKNPPSFDKQFVRDWLESTSWDKNSPPPSLPREVVEQTRAKYIEAYERLTGLPFTRLAN